MKESCEKNLLTIDARKIPRDQRRKTCNVEKFVFGSCRVGSGLEETFVLCGIAYGLLAIGPFYLSVLLGHV